ALALVGVVLALRLAGLVDASRTSHGPNLLLVSIDTLRADRLGAYGAAVPTSPEIDRRLAGEGVVFERCWSQSPKTTPSHMTLLTSLYPPVHGIELWEDTTPGAVLNPRVRTLADVLENAGYATAAFTGGAHVHRSRGFGQGFDVYKHGQELARALAWLDAHPRRKFFLFFHTYQVHDPYLPPEELIARFAPNADGPILAAVRRLRGGAGAGWEAGHRLFWAAVDPQSPGDTATVSRLYDAGIRHMDATTMAPLLDRLDALGLARDTLVVFLSDHGEAFAEHGRFLHDDLYGETLHVPLILRFPGRLTRGTRVPEPVRLVDVMPTILDLLGVPGPPAMQGRSLAPLLRDAAASRGDGVFSDYSNTRARRVFQSLRLGPLTYIVDGGREELFDTAGDPREQRNLSLERPAVLADMRQRLGRAMSAWAPLAARLGPHGAGVAPSDETMRQLRALGYVE
ncbi:MAG TPA: sulfatase, partial [Candidatus Binatia bacterium]|nr:sulfatase [Candidatus Binatia bacterium]